MTRDVASKGRDAVGATFVRDASAIDALIADLPRLDILVNCAGIIRRGAEHDLDVLEDVLSVNLTGTMHCCTRARPKSSAAAAHGGGAIVNTASMLSYQGGALVRRTLPAQPFSCARPRRDS